MKHQISCIEDIKVLYYILNIYYKFILIEFNFRLQEMCHFESVIKIFLYFIKRQFIKMGILTIDKPIYAYYAKNYCYYY